MYAGGVGALAALLLDFIAPESFTYMLSILFLMGSVFGGMTSVWGVVAGGLFLQFWPDIAGMVSRDLVHPVFGAEWRRRGGVAVAMARDMGHASAALTSTNSHDSST